VLLYEDARGVLEDNEISDNFTTGIEVIEGARPVVRGNRIRRNGRQAILVNDGGGGTFEGNDLTGNAGGPWAIHVDCVPDVECRDNVTD
jgi:F-box protein 11